MNAFTPPAMLAPQVSAGKQRSPEPAAPRPLNGTEAIMELQKLIGNHAVLSLLREKGRMPQDSKSLKPGWAQARPARPTAARPGAAKPVPAPPAPRSAVAKMIQRECDPSSQSCSDYLDQGNSQPAPDSQSNQSVDPTANGPNSSVDPTVTPSASSISPAENPYAGTPAESVWRQGFDDGFA